MDYKKTIIILIYLSAQNFFNPFGIIPEKTGKFLFYFFSIVGLYLASRSNTQGIKFPKNSYRWIIIGILISIFSIWINYGQPLSISIMTTLPYIFAYSFFFILIKLLPDIDYLFKFQKILVICSIIIFISNLLFFPYTILGGVREDVDMSRGFPRLGVSMIEIVVFYMLYSINQYHSSNDKKWLVWTCITGVLVILSLTRQIILLAFAFSIMMIIHKAKMWKKIVVICSLFAIYQFVLPQIPIFQAMTELSELQRDMNDYQKEDIRITAWRFYTDEYQKNEITRIIGNGLPSIGNSKNGNQFDNITNARFGGNGCYFVDVGWAGFYWLFGIFATLGLLILLIKALFLAIRFKKDYYAYWILFIIISSVASAPIIFHSQVVSLCIILYMIFKYNEKNEINSINYSQLQ